jgi:hypothetical protein
MLAELFPAHCVSAYQDSPYRVRIDLIGQRLIEQKYLPIVVSQHVREWLRFTTYLQKRKLSFPLSNCGVVAKAYFRQRVRGLSESRTRVIRASVRMFLEADERGRFRQRIGGAERPVAACLSTAVRQYAAFLEEHRGLAPRTVSRQLWKLARFSECLDRLGVMSVEAVSPRHIQRFAVQIRAQAFSTRKGYATALRSFFGWAYAAELVPIDLCAAVVVPRRFRQCDIRDVLSEDEVERILSAVNRSTVTGRRDYATLILAARYGLRPCDIRQLQLDALRWREGTLALRQAKTGHADVAAAARR